jgi:hypothetical protein
MLHIVYRSYGGENTKGRPAYYSKLLALRSLLRARAQVSSPVEILYLNDGPIPADRLSVMERSGEVIARANLGNKGSLRTAYALPAERGWAHDDLVWFAEDDYLYRPDSLSGLIAGAEVWPEADYFCMYASFGSRGSGPALSEGSPMHTETWVPPSWHDSEARLAQAQPWRRALFATSTFGGRVRALIEDERLLNIAMVAGRAFDSTTCLLYQGYLPFPWRLIREPLRESFTAKSFVLAGARLAVDAYHLWRKGPKRLLVAPEPASITHLEAAYLALGTDWTAVARDCDRWAAESSLDA